MARGQKTSPEVIYQVMASWAITNNYNQTAKDLNLPFSTVKNIVQKHKDTEEYAKLGEQKREEFADKATKIIDQLLERLTREVADEEKDIPINHLTIALGTLYDKRALAKGETTQNVGIGSNFNIDKLAEIAGYHRKDDNK